MSRCIILFVVLFYLKTSICLSQATDGSILVGKSLVYAENYFADKNIRYSYKTTIDERTGFSIFIGFKQYNIWALDSIIFYVQSGIDNSMFGDTNGEYIHFKDSTKMKTFLAYWENKYKLAPDFKSTSYGRMNLQESIGVGCGAAGMPTGLAGEIIRMGMEVPLGKPEILQLLLAFDPHKRFAGFYFAKKNKITEFDPLVLRIENTSFQYGYCSGCTGRGFLSAGELYDYFTR